MNNRYETPYTLLRDGFDEVFIGWERVYELTPKALMDKVYELSIKFDKETAVSFPEYWKSDKETDLPALILNNIFGIVPYYDYNGNLSWVRVVNLATNETMQDFPGTENNLLYTCKHILTYCKKVLRSWGKEPYREFRYGQEYLRDRWHKENYPEAFQCPEVCIYDKMVYYRLSPNTCLNRARRALQSAKKEWTPGYYDTDDIFLGVKKSMLFWIDLAFQDAKLPYKEPDQERTFSYLFDKDYIVSIFQQLVEATEYDYTGKTYVSCVAKAILSGVQHFSVE